MLESIQLEIDFNEEMLNLIQSMISCHFECLIPKTG